VNREILPEGDRHELRAELAAESLEAADADSIGGDPIAGGEGEPDEMVADESVPEEPAEADDGGSPRSRILPAEAAESPRDSDQLPTAATCDDNVPFDWYVIRVASGREGTLSSKVDKKLKLSGHDKFVRNVVVPKRKISEVRDGKKRIREEKLYPGYFFMEMQLVEEIWYLLRDTPGVGDFVGGGSKPIPMVASEVKKLLDIIEERERDEPPEVKIEVDKNDTVKITDGPFENFEGVVEEVHPGKGQVRVMVTIFGRETPVDLEYWQVEKV
jgi:transcriptional antiterminator NusG